MKKFGCVIHASHWVSLKRFSSLTAAWFSMDDHTKKRPAAGLELSKRSSGLSLRESKQERSVHECNRTGCSNGHNLRKSTQNSGSEKLKYLKPPLRFKSNNPNAASSSRSVSSSINLNMSCHGRKNGESLEEANLTACSNRQAVNEDGLKFDLEFLGRKKEIEYSQGLKPPIPHSFSSSATKILSNSKTKFASRYGKQISQNFVSTAQDSANAPFCQSSLSRIADQFPKSIPHCAIGRPQRYGCASIPDSLPSGSAHDGHDKKSISVRKKFQDGEGSSSGMPSLDVQQLLDDTSSRTKSEYNSRDATVSFGSCLSSTRVSIQIRSNEQEDELIFELPEPILFPTRPHAPLIISEVVQERSSLPFDFENSSFAGRPRSHSRSSLRRSVYHSENVDDYLRLNMEGLAEVLQALERIERDEVLTYEQLMALEANLLDGFSFYDQHRDMRLDIDNMSYEELLALEEKMGSVSTALPEDALSKCLKKSTYRTNFFHMPGTSSHGDDDFKCSICQEEYMIGEELGRLPCKHHYHVTCIQHWLRLKNWCPICKALALP